MSDIARRGLSSAKRVLFRLYSLAWLLFGLVASYALSSLLQWRSILVLFSKEHFGLLLMTFSGFVKALKKIAASPRAMVRGLAAGVAKLGSGIRAFLEFGEKEIEKGFDLIRDRKGPKIPTPQIKIGGAQKASTLAAAPEAKEVAKPTGVKEIPIVVRQNKAAEDGMPKFHSHEEDAASAGPIRSTRSRTRQRSGFWCAPHHSVEDHGRSGRRERSGCAAVDVTAIEGNPLWLDLPLEPGSGSRGRSPGEAGEVAFELGPDPE